MEEIGGIAVYRPSLDIMVNLLRQVERTRVVVLDRPAIHGLIVNEGKLEQIDWYKQNELLSDLAFHLSNTAEHKYIEVLHAAQVASAAAWVGTRIPMFRFHFGLPLCPRRMEIDYAQRAVKA